MVRLFATASLPVRRFISGGPSRRTWLIAAGMASALLWPDLASAHAVLLRCTPASGGAVPAGHLRIDLQFNSRIEHRASQLQVQGADGAPQALTLVDSPTDVLRAETDFVPGTYMLRWQVLAVDGHLTRGLVPFTVTKDAGQTVATSAAP